MKDFDVLVDTFSVIITSTNNLTNYHFSAVVDGEGHHYKIRNGNNGTLVKKEAFGRASVAIHYHAKNQGNIVRFIPVGRVSRKKKKKISKDQMTMFEEGHKYE